VNSAIWPGDNNHAVGGGAADDPDFLAVRLCPSCNDRARANVANVNFASEKRRVGAIALCKSPLLTSSTACACVTLAKYPIRTSLTGGIAAADGALSDFPQPFTANVNVAANARKAIQRTVRRKRPIRQTYD
jgi:hypothetical protein